jgi:hypothetical protein
MYCNIQWFYEKLNEYSLIAATIEIKGTFSKEMGK